MIILSGLLVVLAIALLIAGVVFGNSGTEVVGQDGLALIYVSIAISIVSALCLAIGVFLRRKELFAAVGPTSGKRPKGDKKGRKQAGKVTGGLEPAGGDAATEDTLKIPAQPVDVPGDALVYVVRGRKRYHLDNCRQLMGRQKEELTYAEAQEEGFSPCTACMPDTALAARAAVSGDKGPGATGKRERAGSAAGRSEAPGSAKKRADKAGPTASNASVGAGAPSPGKPGAEQRTTPPAAGGGRRRGPLSSGPRHGESGPGDNETTADGLPGRKRDDAAERAGERSTSGMGSRTTPSEPDSIWLPPAGSAPSPLRAGLPAEERATQAGTAEFETVEPADEKRGRGTRSGDGRTDDTRPDDTGDDDTRASDTRSGDTRASDTRASDTRDEGTGSHGTKSRGTLDHGASEHGGRADDDRETAQGPAGTTESAEYETAGSGRASESGTAAEGPQVRILSGTKRYHRADCALIVDIGDDADDIEALSRSEATARGCTPCLVCEPDKEHARD
ncbi:hypothetical protein [Actinomadura alba]|uniref:Uncharacterized protein n=1 Tax=Actinomadura alba TaxID=406431 RepID=A0ABR7LLC3_9ACTN|nr:hypothetical protein [Actinomadura alba]MBC6465564.1 hypothetical protein [Actinomadura alba]